MLLHSTILHNVLPPPHGYDVCNCVNNLQMMMNDNFHSSDDIRHPPLILPACCTPGPPLNSLRTASLHSRAEWRRCARASCARRRTWSRNRSRVTTRRARSPSADIVRNSWRRARCTRQPPLERPSTRCRRPPDRRKFGACVPGCRCTGRSSRPTCPRVRARNRTSARSRAGGERAGKK